MRAVRQLQSDEIDTLLAQGMGRHYAWAGSNQEIQRSGLTKRRLRRLTGCRPTIALTMHRPDDDNGGAQTMAIQNNNAHRPYVSFSRKTGKFADSQQFTQMGLDKNSSQTK